MHKRVKVCIRVRPASKDHAGIVVNETEKTINVLNNGNGTSFRFDGVLGSSVTQEQVFEKAAMEATESVLHGYNGTVMAYGQTGAGKTFTMTGGKSSFSDRGICARSIAMIFHAIKQDTEHTYTIRASYAEIYNEQLYDLLDFSENQQKELLIQENDKGQTFVKGLSKPLVDSEEAALDLLFQGETNRTIAEHCLNNASTRSHCIFTLHIEKHSHDDNNASIVFSKLNLVDLAGSERMKKTQVTGTMLKETTHINKSLTFLEQVVIALGDHKREHIPYRQTTLTNLLKDSLGGNCRTLLIACVWPDESQNDQTIATLKFATRMMRVKTSAIVNSQDKNLQSAKKYLDEIKRLKQELAMHDTLAGRSNIIYSIPPEAEEEMKQNVLSYITNPTQIPPIMNVNQVHVLFRLFRDIILENQVSTIEQPIILPQIEEFTKSIAIPIPSDEELKQEYANYMQTQMEEAKQNFRKAKRLVVQCATQVNVLKSEIDATSKSLTTEISDEEKDRNVSALRDTKKAYRVAFEELNKAKVEMNYMQKVKEQLITSTLSDFEIWYYY
ncbi:kinesin KIF9 [Thraustotheca clavata]|uniref:Kinesin-like protein n=1 Tax=Thraustotheca clavata TaxID=74557 RepID=A0A1V9YYK5_9STRA|nr:kinesin KIF9 [Thraustotheca clavata]